MITSPRVTGGFLLAAENVSVHPNPDKAEPRQGAKHAKDIIDCVGAALAANCSQAQTDVRG
jgi:hypothetical protein